MHSFSYNIKEEILLGINTKDKADAAMLGLLSFANSLDDKRIMLLTENERVKDFFKLNAERICGEGSVLVDESLKRGDQTLYTIDIQGEAERIELLSYLQIDASRRLTDDDLPKETKDYVEFIEEKLGYPITIISNGPARDDIIYRKSPLKK